MSRANYAFVKGAEPPPVATRPTCPTCAEPLKPMISGGYRTLGGALQLRQWTGAYYGPGAFCSAHCAATFANAAHAAGYRLIPEAKR